MPKGQQSRTSVAHSAPGVQDQRTMSTKTQTAEAGQGATDTSDHATSGAESEAGKGASLLSTGDDKATATATAPTGDAQEDHGTDGGKGKQDGEGEGTETTTTKTGDAGEGGETEVPESYDLKLPENAHLDDKALEGVAEFAKELKLSNEQAQKLLERENAAVQSYVESQTEQRQQDIKAWETEITADKEFGGDHLDESLEQAKTVLKRFDPDGGVLELLDQSGYGSNPKVLRFLARIGKASKDDTIHRGGAPGGGPKTLAERLYPNQA